MKAILKSHTIIVALGRSVPITVTVTDSQGHTTSASAVVRVG